jgi:hypothetical protein
MKAKLAAVKTVTGFDQAYSAFVPKPLPDCFIWVPSKAPAVSAPVFPPLPADGMCPSIEHNHKPRASYSKKSPTRIKPLLTAAARATREATNRTRKLETEKRHEQEFKAKVEDYVARGGRYNPKTRRGFSPEGLARKQAAMDLYNEKKQNFLALLNRPPTYGLPSFYSSDFRSSAEYKFSRFVSKQRFDDVSLSYPERSVSRISDVQESWFFEGGIWHRRSNDAEISVAWTGGVSRWERDFDLTHRLWQGREDEYQVQVKGTGFLYRHLEDSCNVDRYGLLKYHPKEYQAAFKKFFRLRKHLLNFALRSITNNLSQDYVTKDRELVRTILYVSARSINKWTRDRIKLDDSVALIDLLKTESKRLGKYWSEFLQALLPKEARILDRAIAAFHASAALAHPDTEWTQGLVARLFDDCLTESKSAFDYNDSYNAVFWSWTKLDFEQVKSNLPKKFSRQ